LQQWDSTLFEALSKAGGSVYSNYAVGYNNVVPDANKHGIAVGNTPGYLPPQPAHVIQHKTVITCCQHCACLVLIPKFYPAFQTYWTFL